MSDDLLRRLKDQHHNTNVLDGDLMDGDLMREAASEIEKLRAALKPFADIASKLRGDATDWSFFANGSDIRAAAAALKETSNE